jgi:hypothetical protein
MRCSTSNRGLHGHSEARRRILGRFGELFRHFSTDPFDSEFIDKDGVILRVFALEDIGICFQLE